MSLEALIEGRPYGGPLRVAPTDIAGYIRLEQCEQFLKLQLHSRNAGSGFLEEADVAPRGLSSLLSGIGSDFESLVIEELKQHIPVIDFSLQRSTATDNLELVRIAHEIKPGERLALTQPRLSVTLDGWSLRGDIDLLIVERESERTRLLLLDMKSSSTSRIEHRIQIAIYRAMLGELLGTSGVDASAIAMGILYRGSTHPETLSEEEQEKDRIDLEAAKKLGISEARLDLVADPVLYEDVISDLLFANRSVARLVSEKPLRETAYQLTSICDGCFFNEFCLRQAYETDDLSLLPFVGLDSKQALQRSGIASTAQLAALMSPAKMNLSGEERTILAPVAEHEEVCRELGADRAIGGRLQELVSRARRYRRAFGEEISERNEIAGAGYGSLPYSAEDHDPNLVRVYIDVQRDHLVDRLYLAGALVQANEKGVPVETRRRSVVRMTEEPPATDEIERMLLLDFLSDLLNAVIELAVPNEDGELKAPIHLIFYDRSGLQAILQALGRHAETVLGSTALYDFMTQLPAFDSPLISLLSDEIRALKNYPILAPSIFAVARFLGFDWDGDRELTTVFRSHVFDDIRPYVTEEGEEPERWFTGRARFSSDIPLEYAYNAWGRLPADAGSEAPKHSFERASRDDLMAFAERRLAALETITADFKGNNRSYKTPFNLGEIALFDSGEATIATAIDQFIVTERHVAITGWKSERQAMPEQRMLDGVSLVVRYLESDQLPGIADGNREHGVKSARRNEMYEELKLANPEEEKPRLSKEQNAEVRWNHVDTEYRFEIAHPGGSERIERLLGVSQLRVGDRISIAERWSVDTRLPVEEQTRFQTTAKQLLYGDRAEIVGFDRELNADGAVRRVLARLKMVFGQFSGEPGFVFSGRPRVFEEGATYTIEPDPNDVMLSRGRKLARALQEGSVNALVERLGSDIPCVNWPVEAAQGQARFLAGIHAWIETGGLHSFEKSKQRFIGELGDAPTVLVQGPPGTGKSYTTAFAIWARIQGALAAGIPLRTMISCKTHAATAVLLRNIAGVQRDLKLLSTRHRALFSTFFDERLLDVPVYRFDGRESEYPGIRPIYSKGHAANEGTKATDILMARDHLVVGMTPGGNWRLISDRWKDLFANRFIQLVVLDEASQMGLPEAIMATLTLDLEGQLIVVGDQRQMPPIVQHDWANEARRAFKQFAAFESLYLALDRRVDDEHKIKFTESFRLHRDMAEFLRREIYQQDRIPYFSRKIATISSPIGAQALVEAALGPEPLSIILHDEQASQTSNRFEETLVGWLVGGLDSIEGIDPAKDVGVVVPHRSQRSALQERIPFLTSRDPLTGEVVRSAVDTVERFQGDERRVIVVSLTESDPTFIRSTSEFLLDPRRLTVALSRAKEKMIVIASRSVFELIATDETTFANAGLWKNFLKRTCTQLNWSGEIDGKHVDVWANPPLIDTNEESTYKSSMRV
jgi:hypothetical protein